MANLTPTLETERLLLRPATLEDAPAAEKLFNNWNVVKYMNDMVPWPYPEGATLQYYTDILFPSIESKGWLAWAIVEKASGDFVGLMSLGPNDTEDSRGFWIGEPYWRRGYITEAVVATTDYAFDVLKMPKMLLNNATDNLGSRRVKEKAGAQLIASVEGRFVCGTLPKDLWELTPEAWRASPMKQAAPNPSYKIL